MRDPILSALRLPASDRRALVTAARRLASSCVDDLQLDWLRSTIQAAALDADDHETAVSLALMGATVQVVGHERFAEGRTDA